MLLTLKRPWVTDDCGSSRSLTGKAWVRQLGVVTAVDRDKGEITIVPRGGTPSRLTAHPSLLKDVRIWGVAHLFTEGTIVRGIRCL